MDDFIYAEQHALLHIKRKILLVLQNIHINECKHSILSLFYRNGELVHSFLTWRNVRIWGEPWFK